MKTTGTYTAYDVKLGLAQALVRNMVKLVSANERAMSSYKTNSAVLKGGLFYGSSYAAALVEIGSTKRYEFLRFGEHLLTGWANSKWFDTTTDPNPKAITEKVGCLFTLKKGRSPAEGLNILTSKLTLLGCGETNQIALYKTLLEFLGKDKFDALFDPAGDHPFSIGNSPLAPSPSAMFNQSVPLGAKVERGDVVIFSNCKGYTTRHLVGNAQRYITMCVDSTGNLQAHRFTTLGLPSQGLTTGELKVKMMEDFNSKPQHRMLAHERTLIKMMRVNPTQMLASLKAGQIPIPNIKTFCSLGGGKILQQTRVNFDLIMKLFSAPSPEAAVQIFSHYSLLNKHRIS